KPEKENRGNEGGTEVNNSLVEGPEGLAKQSKQDEVKSVLADGDEYVTVNVYNNEYYSHDSNSKDMVAKMEAPEEEKQTMEDHHVHMQKMSLNKAAMRLDHPILRLKAKESLVMYADVKGHPA
ncbi:hypothetical protein C0995_000626, partial [Termitomyces sp. Mi166